MNAGGKPATDYTNFRVEIHQVTTDNVYYSLTEDQYISYLFKAATNGSSVKMILDEKAYESYDDYVLEVSDYVSAKNYKLFAFGNGEDPDHYYYQVIQSKKKVFKNTSVEKLQIE